MIQPFSTTVHSTKRSLVNSKYSHISNFPLEILSEIFAHIIPWDPRYVWERSLVLNLALVCKTWYNAAVSTHSLWTGAIVQASHGDVAYQKAANWLKRAGILPRTLVIEQEWYENADDDNSALAASQILADGPLFHAVAVHCKGPKFFRNLLDKITPASSTLGHPTPWQTLKSFTLLFACEAWPSDPTVLYDQSESMWESEVFDNPALSVFQMFPPSITALDLRLPPQYVAFKTRRVPYTNIFTIPSPILQQLTHLSIYCDWDGAHILDVLDHCQNVKVLSIGLGGEPPLSHEALPARKSRINLESLEKLILLDVGNLEHLRYIRAPNLRKLDISVLGECRPDDPFEIEDGSEDNDSDEEGPDGEESNVDEKDSDEEDSDEHDSDEEDSDGDEDNGNDSYGPDEICDIPMLLKFLSASGKLDADGCLEHFALEFTRTTPPSHLCKLLFSSLRVKHMQLIDVYGIPWDRIARHVESNSKVLSNTALETFELLDSPEGEQFPLTQVCAFLRSRGGEQIQLKGSSRHIQTPIVSIDAALSVSIDPL